jgi:hypothetical protein
MEVTIGQVEKTLPFLSGFIWGQESECFRVSFSQTPSLSFFLFFFFFFFKMNKRAEGRFKLVTSAL